MRNYLIRRIVYSIVLLFFTMTAIFFMLRTLPNGPFDRINAERAALGKPGIAQTEMARLYAIIGLDRPVHEQYIAWLRAMVSGDLGASWSAGTGRSVTSLVFSRVPYTVLLILCGAILAIAVALPLGMYSALHPYSDSDMIMTSMSFFGMAMPSFWFGIILISVFYLGLGWLPMGGVVSREMSDYGDILAAIGRVLTLGLTNQRAAGHEVQLFYDGIKHLILPTITLSLVSIARWSRFVRAAILEVLGSDYIRTAQAYGVPRKRLMLKHVLRNGLIPLITVMAVDIPTFFTGAIIIEIVFTWPGIGRLYLDGLRTADWPLLQGLLIVNTLLIVGANFVADLAYAVADPRIRYA